MITYYVLIASFGGIGGLLFGLHKNEGLLVPQRVAKYKWRLGFIRDWLFGAAGGFIIFLTMPEVDLAHNTPTFIRVLGLCLVGGYGSEALLEAMVSMRVRQLERNRRDRSAGVANKGEAA